MPQTGRLELKLTMKEPPMMLDRLRRVTDLFVEGAEAYFGLDDAGKPVIVWVNKLNSFEVEEARQDGLTARGVALLRLLKEDSPERLTVSTAVDGWTDEQLIDALVAQKRDEIYLQVLSDMEGDEEWGEKIRMMRRLPVLLADADAPDDDPRRQELYDLQTSYLDAMRKANEAAEDDVRRDYQGRDRADLAKEYFENWRSRASLDDFMSERRVTEFFYAIRDCQAVEAGRNPDGTFRWDHGKCDHSVRLLNERSQVRSLPEPMLEKVSNVIEEITVSPRESGNSGAPQSSSESAERPSEAEVSTPSTPEETQPAAPTT